MDATGEQVLGINVDVSAPIEQPTTPEEKFIDKVPEQYRDKEYFKNIKSMDEMFNQFVNAQSLIGKRPAGIPSENASEQEWSKFYELWGRPETADKYSFGDKEVNPKVKEMFYKHGLNTKQASGLLEEFNALNEELKLSEEEKTNLEFDQLAVKYFGDDRNQVIEKANMIISKHTPEELKPYLSKLPNEQLVILTKFVTDLEKKYKGESSIIEDGGNQAIGDKKAERMKLLIERKELYSKNPLDPRIDDLTKKISLMY